MELEMYHGTDHECAEKILENGFIHRENKNHWLGNGIYFYIDRSLAKWWTTNPTQKFGVKITQPCILTVRQEIPTERILDLRSLEGYIDCINAYKEFMEIAQYNLSLNDEHDRSKIRCAFFDWIFFTYEIDCIIGTFYLVEQEYLKSEPETIREVLRAFNLPYIETQVCVKQGVIKTHNIVLSA